MGGAKCLSGLYKFAAMRYFLFFLWTTTAGWLFFAELCITETLTEGAKFPEAFIFEQDPFVHELKTVTALNKILPPSVKSTTSTHNPSSASQRVSPENFLTRFGGSSSEPASTSVRALTFLSTVSTSTSDALLQTEVSPVPDSTTASRVLSEVVVSTQLNVSSPTSSASSLSSSPLSSPLDASDTRAAGSFDRDDSLVVHLVERSAPRLLVIMFYVYWCPHCHRAAPVYRRLAYSFRCTPDVLFLAFECAMNWPSREGDVAEACQVRGADGYPTLMVYHVADAKSYEEIDAPRSVKGMTEWITDHTCITQVQHCTASRPPVLLPEANNIVTAPLVSASADDAKAANKRVERWDFSPSACPDERLHDAVLGFLYLLKNWVIGDTSASFRQDKYERLLQLLNVTASLFPGRNVRQAVANFQQELLNEGPQLTGHVYHRALNRLSLAGLTPERTGIQPPYLMPATPTSSLWLFFHTLTVALMARASTVLPPAVPLPECPNGPVNPSTSAVPPSVTPPKTSPEQLVEVIRSTVAEFFFCKLCQAHFLRTTQHCRDVLCGSEPPATSLSSLASLPDVDANDLHTTARNSRYGVILWLWRLHNRVTYRTAVERTADSIATLEEFQGLRGYDSGHPTLYEGLDVRFPPPSLCPRCRNSAFEPKRGGNDDNAAAPANTRLVAGRSALSDVNEEEEASNNRDDTGALLADPGVTVSVDGELQGQRSIRALLAPPRDEQLPIVSEALVLRFLRWERVARGLIVNNDSVPFPDADDDVFDRIDAFNLTETAHFLYNYFWRPDWSPDNVELQWNGTTLVFQTSSTVPYASALRNNNHVYNETAASTTLYCAGASIGGVSILLILAGLSGKLTSWTEWARGTTLTTPRHIFLRTSKSQYNPIGRACQIGSITPPEILTERPLPEHRVNTRNFL